MSGKVVHFEISYDDGDRARAFYSSVFGWQLMPLPDMEYTMATTGPTGEQGNLEAGFINGALRKRSELFDAPDIVIDVDNLEETVAAAVAAGGEQIMGRQAVGEMGFTAYIRDTEGTVVGLWETAKPS